MYVWSNHLFIVGIIYWYLASNYLLCGIMLWFGNL